MRALIFGQAQYIATERGYVLANASMVVLYGLYAKSHLYQGMELLVYLILFHTQTCLKKSLLYSWYGLADIACHVIGCRLTQETRVQSALDDRRSHIDTEDDHIDTVISHIVSPYPISISKMTIWI
jgi:hypothetical protein